MGVPKFYRWLSERYPLVNQNVSTRGVPPCDNFFLDMNGIIHNCTHGNDTDPSKKLSEQEMVVKIFTYIDRLVGITRPQKLIFLAVDGCAPRAKVNQQRARRFKSGKERLELEAEARNRGEEVPEDAFDSNCITPGTAFLQRLDNHLRFYIRKKISEDPLWQRPQVILSGPLVPGEGEHKVMEYLRWAKKDANYKPNQRHCLYGLDADLIMLALVTHEPHFFLLREQVSYGKNRGRPSREVLENPCAEHFTLLNIGLLREYWQIEYKELNLPQSWFNIERVIDDIVLICMLVGNDFLPSLPTLDIAEGALDNMLDIYKTILPKMKGYLHEDGDLIYKNFEAFLLEIAKLEKEVLELRAVDADTQDNRQRKWKKRDARMKGNNKTQQQKGDAGDGDKEGAKAEDEKKKKNVSEPTMMSTEARALILSDGDAGLQLWKDRYYMVKLECDGQSDIFKVTEEYIRGITWVLQYYYRGVISWDWYYPYHYAPMASEVKALGELKRPEYNYGRPFNPFQQLLAVMPASSAKLFPQVYQELILNQNSPLRTPVDYFPTDFDLDMEGKRADWEGIVLIPFIDEKVLLEAERTHINVARLKKEELERNSHGPVLTFYYDQKSTENLFCQSTIPSQFTSVTASKSRVMMVAPPPPFPANEKGFTATITKGTTMGLQNPVGYPTMSSLKVASRLDGVGVNVFGMASKKKSLVLESQAPSLGNIQLQQIGKALLGERCFIDWPYLNESTICALSDKTGYYDNHGFKPHTGGSFDSWEDKADRCLERYLTKYAIDIGESSFFVHVRDCIDMTSMPDGSIKKEFSDTETMHPIQVILRSNPFEKRGKGSLQTETQKRLLQSLKPGSKVLYLSEPYYGCVATVLKGGSKMKKGSKGQQAKLNIQLVPTPEAEKNNRVTAKRMMTNFPTRYLPDGFLTKKLAMSYRVLGMITGMVNAKDSQKNNVALGLSLKSRSQGAIVPDYVRAVTRGENVTYEYSNATFQILKQYKQKFPWVFDAVAKEGKKDYLAVDFFGKIAPEEADKRLYAVRNWLKTLPVSRRPMVKQEAKIAAEDSVRALQQALLPTAVSASHSKPIHLEDVQLINLLTPADPSLPRPYILKIGNFDLGDRVASVGGHANVAPFGSMGTVVGVYPNGLVEVVFDTEYLGGKDLYGRCKKRRGNIVPPFCLLNTTKPINTQTLTQTRQANLKAKKAEERKRETKAAQQQKQKQQAVQAPAAGAGETSSMATVNLSNRGGNKKANNKKQQKTAAAPKVDQSVTVTRPKPQPPKKEAMGKALLNMLQQQPKPQTTASSSSSSTEQAAESTQVNAGMELLKMLQNSSLGGGENPGQQGQAQQ